MQYLLKTTYSCSNAGTSNQYEENSKESVVMVLTNSGNSSTTDHLGAMYWKRHSVTFFLASLSLKCGKPDNFLLLTAQNHQKIYGLGDIQSFFKHRWLGRTWKQVQPQLVASKGTWTLVPDHFQVANLRQQLPCKGTKKHHHTPRTIFQPPNLMLDNVGHKITCVVDN